MEDHHCPRETLFRKMLAAGAASRAARHAEAERADRGAAAHIARWARALDSSTAQHDAATREQMLLQLTGEALAPGVPGAAVRWAAKQARGQVGMMGRPGVLNAWWRGRFWQRTAESLEKEADRLEHCAAPPG